MVLKGMGSVLTIAYQVKLVTEPLPRNVENIYGGGNQYSACVGGCIAMSALTTDWQKQSKLHTETQTQERSQMS